MSESDGLTEDGFWSFWLKTLRDNRIDCTNNQLAGADKGFWKFWWKWGDPALGIASALLLTPFFWAQWTALRYVQRTFFYVLLQRLVGNPMYGAAVALIGFIAAAIASTFSTEIRRSFSLARWITAWYKSGFDFHIWRFPDAVPVVIFWAIAFAWLYLYTALEAAKSKSIGILQEQSQLLENKVQGVESNVSKIGSAAGEIGQAVHTVEGAVGSVREQTFRIIEAVHTVPPPGFIEGFCRASTSLQTTLTRDLPRRSDNAANKAQFELIVRVLLCAVANLASLYDVGRRVRYAANAMVFEPKNPSEPFFPNHLEKEVLHFLPRGFWPGNLSGVLFLPKALSAIGSRELITGVEQDPDIEEVIFGIPNEPIDENGRWLVLPGAPLAFAKWEINRSSRTGNKELREAVHGIDNMSEFRSLVKGDGIHGEKFNLEDSLITKVEDYYVKSRPSQFVRSFQSFPLVDNTGKAIGVLNVHCNHATLLGPVQTNEAELRQATFAGIITPLVFEIANIVSLWKDAPR
jgi:hypothetical protein